MTGKRFTFMQDILGKADVFDGSEFVCCTLSVWVEQLVDLLNQLNDENEQLKQNCENYEWYKQYKQLLNENENLKQQIKNLRINILDSIHEADEIKCTCNPCVVEECVKKVVE